MKNMKKLIRIFDSISFCGAAFASAVLAAGLLLILVEIFMRTALNSTTYIATEYPGYICAAVSFMGLGYTLSLNGHIRMSFVFLLLKGKPGIVWNILIHLIGFVVSACLIVISWDFFYASYTNGTVSMKITQTPLAVPQFFIFLGTIILTLQFISETCKLVFMLKGDENIKVAEGSEFI